MHTELIVANLGQLAVLIGKHTQVLAHIFNLDAWDVESRVTTEALEGSEDNSAVCLINSTYMNATVSVRLTDRGDRREGYGKSITSDILHELLHVVHADFDAFGKYLDGNTACSVLTQMLSAAEEKAVVQLERLLSDGDRLLALVQERAAFSRNVNELLTTTLTAEHDHA